MSNFWAKVMKLRGCWEWSGALFWNGYGQFKNKRAHRVSWELHHGKIPEGKLVLHKCDNRRCVRPAHLFIGTQQDNINDMFMKGRENKVKGERVAGAKLTNKKVLEIRIDKRLHKEIALEYGVCRPLITMIKNKTRWSHI